jgi:hypothetical protein
VKDASLLQTAQKGIWRDRRGKIFESRKIGFPPVSTEKADEIRERAEAFLIKPQTNSKPSPQSSMTQHRSQRSTTPQGEDSSIPEVVSFFVLRPRRSSSVIPSGNDRCDLRQRPFTDVSFSFGN